MSVTARPACEDPRPQQSLEARGQVGLLLEVLSLSRSEVLAVAQVHSRHPRIQGPPHLPIAPRPGNRPPGAAPVPQSLETTLSSRSQSRKAHRPHAACLARPSCNIGVSYHTGPQDAWPLMVDKRPVCGAHPQDCRPGWL